MALQDAPARLRSDRGANLDQPSAGATGSGRTSTERMSVPGGVSVDRTPSAPPLPAPARRADARRAPRRAPRCSFPAARRSGSGRRAAAPRTPEPPSAPSRTSPRPPPAPASDAWRRQSPPRRPGASSSNVSRRDRLDRTTRAAISSPEASTTPDTASPDSSSRATGATVLISTPAACAAVGQGRGERRHAAARNRHRALQAAHLLRRAPSEQQRRPCRGRATGRPPSRRKRRPPRIASDSKAASRVGGSARRALPAQSSCTPAGAPSSHHSARWARAKANSSRRKSTQLRRIALRIGSDAARGGAGIAAEQHRLSLGAQADLQLEIARGEFESAADQPQLLHHARIERIRAFARPPARRARRPPVRRRRCRRCAAAASSTTTRSPCLAPGTLPPSARADRADHQGVESLAH